MKLKLLHAIAKRILMWSFIRRALALIYSYYALTRYEKGYDNFLGGYFSRPWIKTPSNHLININISTIVRVESEILTFTSLNQMDLRPKK